MYVIYHHLSAILTTETTKVGRPFLYGLMIAGQEGVEQILKQTMADLHISLGLSGWRELDDIRGRREDVLVKLDF